jgi:hypothetical protein
LRVSENKRARRAFVPKKEGVAGGCRKYHNEELHNLYSSRNIISAMKSRVVKWAGRARMAEVRSAYKVFVRKFGR